MVEIDFQERHEVNGKIALEEHFATPEYNQVRPHFLAEDSWPDIQRRIVDFADLRLAEMDRYGIEIAVVSLTSPGIQGESDPALAVERAARSNEILAKAIADHPDRFGGFAAIPLQDVGAAVAELTRSVTELGFRGVLVNDWTDMPNGSVRRLDALELEPFWSTLEALAVPLYLHPRLLPQAERGAVVDRPELAGPVWEFTTAASASALRLITSGLFDRYPHLQVILGHMGETLPYNMWRIENRMRKAGSPAEVARPLTEYLTSNFYVTTSGHFSTPALLAALDVMGPDRVMFSVDYPYDEMPQAATWFDGLEIDPRVHEAVGRGNAARLLHLAETGGL